MNLWRFEVYRTAIPDFRLNATPFSRKVWRFLYRAATSSVFPPDNPNPCAINSEKKQHALATSHSGQSTVRHVVPQIVRRHGPIVVVPTFLRQNETDGANKQLKNRCSRQLSPTTAGTKKRRGEPSPLLYLRRIHQSEALSN